MSAEHDWNEYAALTAEFTPDMRLGIARRHLIAAARQYDLRGWVETHKAVLMAVDALDDAREAAHD